jgi:hypothetical protein
MAHRQLRGVAVVKIDLGMDSYIPENIDRVVVLSPQSRSRLARGKFCGGFIWPPTLPANPTCRAAPEIICLSGEVCTAG